MLRADNADAAQSMKEALEINGHEVAGTGPDGVSMAHSFQPDVVVCDISLPGFDGYEVARLQNSVSADPRCGRWRTDADPHEAHHRAARQPGQSPAGAGPSRRNTAAVASS